ncbi:TetR/AcrR family transcriptional regulator [bacterium]|nr:TetR/AcrR family transcriptional regulator [bacterium]
MARRKDADKRRRILDEAKRMFAGDGFERTSMGTVAERAGIPVGSLYTYFDSKETLLGAIIEEGWAEFATSLEKGLAKTAPGDGAARDAAGEALGKLSFLVLRAFPALLHDADLIAIILAQADRGSLLAEKLEHLASLIAAIIAEYHGSQAKGGESIAAVPGLKAGIAVMLLGSLETARLIRRAEVGLAMGDVSAFLASTVEAALGCSLPRGVGTETLGSAG